MLQRYWEHYQFLRGQIQSLEEAVQGRMQPHQEKMTALLTGSWRGI
jgi:hypothetical protein